MSTTPAAARRAAVWYFDFVSPFAYLQWQRIRTFDEGVLFECRPVLLAGLLDHHGQKGPAEIEPKRHFTYRYVAWRARRAGVPLRFPPAHPFNSLHALRLCMAAGCSSAAVDALFDHIWRDGKPGDSPPALAGVVPGVPDAAAAVAGTDAKAGLRRNFDHAVADGVFGVPTIVCEGVLFWGDDATAMFEDFLAAGCLPADDEARLATLPVGAARKPRRGGTKQS